MARKRKKHTPSKNQFVNQHFEELQRKFANEGSEITRDYTPHPEGKLSDRISFLIRIYLAISLFGTFRRDATQSLPQFMEVGYKPTFSSPKGFFVMRQGFSPPKLAWLNRYRACFYRKRPDGQGLDPELDPRSYSAQVKAFSKRQALHRQLQGGCDKRQTSIICGKC